MLYSSHDTWRLVFFFLLNSFLWNLFFPVSDGISGRLCLLYWSHYPLKSESRPWPSKVMGFAPWLLEERSGKRHLIKAGNGKCRHDSTRVDTESEHYVNCFRKVAPCVWCLSDQPGKVANVLLVCVLGSYLYHLEKHSYRLYGCPLSLPRKSI